MKPFHLLRITMILLGVAAVIWIYWSFRAGVGIGKWHPVALVAISTVPLGLVSLSIGELLNGSMNSEFTFAELLPHRFAVFIIPLFAILLIVSIRFGACWFGPTSGGDWDWMVHPKKKRKA